MKQLQLLDLPSSPSVFRPIHYLGSKLRLVPVIRSVIDRIDPAGPLCDLFAGSGTVALAMSASRPVVAVDIQEYSRVLCSALLRQSVGCGEIGRRVALEARESLSSALLTAALTPLIEYEDDCIRRATQGDVEPLCDFIEHGSLAWFAATGAKTAGRRLRVALQTVSQHLRDKRLSDRRSLITRQFGGSYFSFRQSAELDALLTAAHNLPEHARDAGIAPILSTTSEIVNTVGKHFAQPIRPRSGDGQPKRQLVDRVIKDRRLTVSTVHRDFVERYALLPVTAGQHVVVRDDFETFLATFTGKISIFYADPPYTRDHYSRFYHVLETMCLHDEPEISTSTGRLGKGKTVSRGFYRADRHQSPFCIKSQAHGAFARMFAGVKNFGVPLVLSYSPFNESSAARPRLMRVEDIIELARRHFRNVETASVGSFAHSKLNLQDRNAPINRDAEVLIICHP